MSYPTAELTGRNLPGLWDSLCYFCLWGMLPKCSPPSRPLPVLRVQVRSGFLWVTQETALLSTTFL